MKRNGDYMSEFFVELNNKHIFIQQSPQKICGEETLPSEQLCIDTNDHEPLLQSNISTADDRFVVLFDGVIYNEVSLQQRLNQPLSKEHQPTTEQLIANLFNDLGPSLFSLIHGKFVIVIWDSVHHILYGARDQFGIKPLFFQDSDSGCLISNVRKLITNYDRSIDPKALQHYLSFQYVPQPLSITKGLRQLTAGHYFIKEGHEPIVIERYFHAICQPNQSLHKQDVICQIQETLWETVNNQMPPDRPVGSFLSGGIDSSLIASIARKIRPDLTAISVGFSEHGYSELDIAKRTAEVIGVNHVTHVITCEEFKNTIPKVIKQMADPIADPSCIPLYIAAREAKKHADVVLSGEGADEMFGGYNIYREHESLKYITHLPDVFLRAFQYLATIIPEGVKGKSFLQRATTPLEKRYIGNAKIFEEREKMNLLTIYDGEHTYEQWTELFYKYVHHRHPVEQMQYIDLNLWLSGNILPKAYQMAVAHGLDVRMPFLDPALFQVAQHIPVSFKVSNGTTKVILREAAQKWAPEHVINQQKLGFPVPLHHWLRNELYEWAFSIINESRTDHLIQKRYALQLLNEHRTSFRNHSRKLWTILIFMIWHDLFMETNAEDMNKTLATIIG